MSLLCNMLSRFVIAFLPRGKHLLVSWLQSPSAVIWEPKKIKSVLVSTFSWSHLPWRDGTKCHDLSECWVLSQLFHSLSPSSRGLLPLEWHHLHIWGCWYFSWQSWFQCVITLKKKKNSQHSGIYYIANPVCISHNILGIFTGFTQSLWLSIFLW